MRNLLLLNKGIDLNNLLDFENGINKLNIIITNKTKRNNFFKENDLYDYNFNFGKFNDLYNNEKLTKEFKFRVLYKFIESFKNIEIECNSLDEIEELKNDCNGYMGIEFKDIVNEDIKKNSTPLVTDLDSFKAFNKFCIINSSYLDRNLIKNDLDFLFPEFIFSKNSIDDIINIKSLKNNFGKLIDLLEDIEKNPTKGELGHTKVLQGGKKNYSKKLRKVKE